MDNSFSPSGLSGGCRFPERTKGCFSAFALALALCLVCAPAGLPAREGASPGAERTAPPSAADEEFLKINSLFNRDLYDLAIPRYRKLLETYPDFAKKPMVHYALALCYHSLAMADSEGSQQRNSHLRSAADQARLALRSAKPESRREAMELLGQDLIELGEHEDAAKVYRALLEESKEGEETSAVIGLGDAHYHQGEHEAAARFYRQALALLADGGEKRLRERASFHLGLCLYEMGDGKLREALGIFEELSGRAGPLRDDSLYMAAMTHQKLGDNERSLARFEKLAAKDAPRWQEAGLFGKGSALFHSGKYADAAAAFETMRRRFPQSEQRDLAGLYLGRAFIKLGKLRSGARLLNELRRSPSLGADASLWLARAYSSKDKHSQAIKIIEAALRKYGQSPARQTLELELGIELIADKRFAESAKVLQDLLKRYPDFPAKDHVAYLQAYTLHQTGDYQASAGLSRTFLETYPRSRFRREVRQLAAENAFLAGDYEESGKLYESFLADFSSELAPEDALLARYRIAEARFLRGDRERARTLLDALNRGETGRALREAIDRDPLFESYHYLLGDVCYELEDYERAVRELTAYLARENPRHGSDARFKLAHSLQLGGKLDAARQAYEDALSRDPRDPHSLQMRFELGQISLEKKDYKAASAAFHTVVEDSPRSRLAPHACHFLGWIAQQEERYQDAARWFKKLVDDFPEHDLRLEAQYLLALSLQSDSRFDEAREVLRELEKESPEAGIGQKIRLQEAINHARQGRKEKAVELLERLRQESLSSDLAVVLHYELAWGYRGIDRLDKAAAAYREVLRLAAAGASADSGDDLASAARLELAELEFDRGNMKASAELLEPLARGAGASREKALYRLCWCHYREGDLRALDATCRTLEKDYPGSERLGETAILLARSYLEKKDFAEAAKIFSRIARAEPPPKEAELAIVSYAECLNEQRKFEEARATLEAFLRKYPASSHLHRAHFALGWAAENEKRLDLAMAHYKKAIGVGSPISARAQFQIGQCFAAREKYDDAIVEFLQVPARYSYPEWSARAILQVAGSFEALDDLEKARRYYREVIGTYPERDEARLAAQRLKKISE